MSSGRSALANSNHQGRNSLGQFIQFGMVGGSGVFVNLFAMYLSKKTAEWGFGLHQNDVFMNLLGTSFNIRWYPTFLPPPVADATARPPWWRCGPGTRPWAASRSSGYIAFLTTGVLAFLVSLVVTTLLMNPTSPIALPSDVFDDSTGLRTKLYYASAIAILVSMPVNFIINKLWAFRKPRTPKVIIHTEPYAAHK